MKIKNKIKTETKTDFFSSRNHNRVSLIERDGQIGVVRFKYVLHLCFNLLRFHGNSDKRRIPEH